MSDAKLKQNIICGANHDGLDKAAVSARGTYESDLLDIINGLPPILTVEEAAKFMRLSTRTVRRLFYDGHLQVIKCGVKKSSRVLVPRGSIYRWMLEATK